jgi:hypothetical protein
VGQQIIEPIRSGADNQNRDGVASQVLLVLESPIYCEEEIKASGFGERKQQSILLAGQAHFGHSLAFIIGECVLKLPRNTFVKQDLHPN